MDQDPCLSAVSLRQPVHTSILAVSSRRRALDCLRTTIAADPGQPILITGEPGAGKTWLIDQLCRLLPSTWRSARVDLTRATSALDFFHLLGYCLGMTLPNSLGTARTGVQASLQDEAADGRHWLLIVDEAHHAAAVVWDEIKVLANQSGQPGGFVSIVVLGDTAMVRMLGTRDFRGLVPQVGTHLHLPPLDLDEARDLLAFTSHNLDRSDRELEELQRDARGNPRKLLDLASRSSLSRWPTAAIGSDRGSQAHETSPTQRTPDRSSVKDFGDRDRPPSTVPEPALQSATGFVMNAPTDPPILGSSKPPLRIEEGLVEVGWDGDLETEAGETAYGTTEAERLSGADTSFNEELIEDRYAALQAWTEWKKIQGQATNRGGATEGSMPRVATEPQTARSQTVKTEAESGVARADARDARRPGFGPSLNMSSLLTASFSPGCVNQNSLEPGAWNH